jgi:hypothetical protein
MSDRLRGTTRRHGSVSAGGIKALALVFIVSGSGCGSISLDMHSGERSFYVPARHMPPAIAYEYIPSPETSHFELRAQAKWIFWTVPLNHPDWEDLSASVLDGADAISNFRVQTQTRFGDALLGCLTLGFYRSTQVIVSGERIRFVAPVPPPQLLDRPLPASPSPEEIPETAVDANP